MDVALQSSVWVTSPEFAGWLNKRGFHWRKLWKKRWVALHGAEIVYMDKEPTIENSSSLTMTKAQISASTVIERDDIDGNPNGFAIHINDGHTPTWYLRADSSREKKSWLMRLAHVHAIVRWLEDFEKVRILGVGGTGIVYELLHKTNGLRYAMKEMEIKNKSQMDMAIQEAEMLKDIMENISHKNIMHIEKVFQVGSKFYLVFPLCTGGELYEHIIRRGHFSEYDAAVIFRDLISGLHALHSHDILHLDIKPENILFDTNIIENDPKIKITDFGLSKVFSNLNESQRKPPTMEDISQKLKAFSESGVLDRDRLRGTVGYMSPELILTGYSSKATDVFAAGVVLYILLCGRPPFQSKSNREILEKTARGIYRMEGDEWEDISDDAKDLVRKMLIVDPSKRITTDEILSHPWLQLDDEIDNQLDNQLDSKLDGVLDSKIDSKLDSNIDTKLTSKSTMKRKTSNLSGALKYLSSHVNQLRTEKLATGFTSLLTSMKSNKNSTSSLLSKYVHLTNTTNENESEVMPSSEEETMMLMNPDIRDALSSAIMKFGEEPGKLSVQQFICVLKQLVGVNKANNTSANSAGGNSGQGLAFVLLCRFIDRDGDGFISADDIFTSQALVSQRSDIFLKAIFRIYSEAIWYPGRQLNFMHLLNKSNNQNRTTNSNTQSTNKVIEDQLHIDVVEPPKFITARHVSTIFEKLGFDPSGGVKLFNVLCDALVKKRRRVSQIEEGNENQLDERDTFIDSQPNSSLVDVMEKLNVSGESSPDKKSSDSTNQSIPSSNSCKMDVQDFIRACEIDDVLIQVLLYRPRSRLSELFRKAYIDANDSDPNKISVLECELLTALQSASTEKQKFPIAKAVGRATLSAAFGLAAKVTQGAQVLIDATYEGIEGGDKQTDGETYRRSEVDEDYQYDDNIY